MKNLFDIKNKVVVVTGSTGVLAGNVAQYLAQQGAQVVFIGRNEEKLQKAVQQAQSGNKDCFYCVANVLDKNALQAAYDKIMAKCGRIDALVNGAGGNMPGAVIPPDKSVFDLDFEQWRAVIDLNLGGTMLPILVFGRAFEKQKEGVIVNFSSMAAEQALTRVLGYSNAKSGINNLTRWLAVEFAKKTGEKVRVNAVAPGFFISEQNRALLTNPDGSYTERGTQVINKTPFGRFGKCDEINGTVHYLISDASAFVTGTIMAVDGGFSAFTGV